MKSKSILSAVAFIVAIAGAFASNALVYEGYKKPVSGGSCTTYSSIPDNCLTTNSGNQCQVTLSGTTYNLFSGSACSTDTQAVKLP